MCRNVGARKIGFTYRILTPIMLIRPAPRREKPFPPCRKLLVFSFPYQRIWNIYELFYVMHSGAPGLLNTV